MKNDKYFTIQEIADILGITRIAVYKKVKKGQIKALKIGRNFAVPKKYIAHILGKALNSEDKRRIEKDIKKTVKEYGETLRFLGRE